MCLAIPVKVIQCLPDDRAIVNVGGIEREITTVLVKNLVEGDYVILHVGYALTKLDEASAQKTLQLFEGL